MKFVSAASFIALLASSATAFSIVGPAYDPFYDPPSNLSDYGLGEVIRERDVTSLLILSGVASIKQVFYRTNNTNGEASHTVATVFTPQNPDGDHKLLSYQFWEDSNGANCAPSYSIQDALFAPDGVVGAADFPVWVDYAMGNGWYLVAADHEGPRGAFSAGHEEGQNGLDGVRAALNSLNLPVNTPVALHGYSGGAGATAWMVNLAESYAPDLNIAGAAYGGTPIDLKDMFLALDGTSDSGFEASGFTGLLSAYSQYQDVFFENVTPTFVNAIKQINSTNFCLSQILQNYANITFAKETHFPGGLWEYPAIKDIVGRESLLSNVSTVGVSAPKFPRFIYHSEVDEIVPFAPENQYVQQQCAQGANIQFKKIAAGGHVETEATGLPSALVFVKQIFDGTTPQVTCGSAPPDWIEIVSNDLQKIIGDSAHERLLDMNGMDTPFGTIKW